MNLNLLAIEYALGEYERGMITVSELVETVMAQRG